MKLFVVHMYRWGDEELHSYIEGVYSSHSEAERHGKAEQECRAGKYEPKIWVHELNQPRLLKYMSEDQITKQSNDAIDKLEHEDPELYAELIAVRKRNENKQID